MVQLDCHLAIDGVHPSFAQRTAGSANQTCKRSTTARPSLPMLFVIAMDVLNYLIFEADACTLLDSIGGSRGIPHRHALYTDDATLFLTLVSQDLRAITQIPERPRVCTLILRRAPSPLSDAPRSTFSSFLLNYGVISDFLCKYLGLPHSTRKPTKEDFP